MWSAYRVDRRAIEAGGHVSKLNPTVPDFNPSNISSTDNDYDIDRMVVVYRSCNNRIRDSSHAVDRIGCRAHAAESALCAYLSIIALMGLAVHAIWHIAWADAVAALVITPLIVFEAREAVRGKPCGCC